jgi:2-keto-3-deoxy-L-fuconate dehydrogenase
MPRRLDMDLTGKKIFISAAGAGMGYSVAKLALNAGAKIYATDLKPAGLEKLSALGAETETLDITKDDLIQNYFFKTPDFDGIVNMAGWVHHGTILDVNETDWRNSFLINLDSMYFVIKAAIPGLQRNGGGSIVNMASLASSVKGFPFRAAYSTSKAAVIGLTKSVAVDFMNDGIRCNAICPGTIETPSLHERMDNLAEKLGSKKAATDWFVSRQPMGRLGQPDEIASLIIYLLSDAGSYATGQPFIVDGGTIA